MLHALALVTALVTAPDLSQSAATVFIVDSEGYLRGSGTAWALDGQHLITAEHVCEGAVYLYIELDQVYVFEIEAVDKGNDLCMLHGQHPLKPLKVRRKSLRRGEHVYVYGSPLRFAGVLTEGFVGPAIYLKGMGLRQQLSVPAFGGNSGGPVVDDRGRVVGVLVAGVPKYPMISFSVLHSALLYFVDGV